MNQEHEAEQASFWEFVKLNEELQSYPGNFERDFALVENTFSEDVSKLYAEFVDWANPHEVMRAATKAGKLQEYRSACRTEYLKTLPPKVEVEVKYPKPTLQWREIFTGVRDRALERFAIFEEPEWEVVFSGTGSVQLGNSKMQEFKLNKDRWLIPGVWHLRAHKNTHPKTGAFISSDTLARYMKIPSKEYPNLVEVLTGRPGRPKEID